MQEQQKNSVTSVPENLGRRKAMKKIGVGVGVLAGCSVLPEKWTRPIVGQIILPAHAETSGVEASSSATAPAGGTGEYNTTETYSLRSIPGNDKNFTWLNETGANYGGQIKFEYSDGCGELIVPDAKVSHGADGNTTNHNQAFYFCGTDFPAGTKEYNAGRASVFTPPGCRASSVTLFYNK